MLKLLKLVPNKKSYSNNVFLKPRRKLIAKIDEQILLAIDSNYKPTKIKSLHNEDSSKRKLEIPKRIRRWWTKNIGISIYYSI